MADEVEKINAEVIAVYPDKIKIVVDCTSSNQLRHFSLNP